MMVARDVPHWWWSSNVRCRGISCCSDDQICLCIIWSNNSMVNNGPSVVHISTIIAVKWHIWAQVTTTPHNWHNIVDEVMSWKYFLYYWPFVRGIHQSLDFPRKGQIMQSFNVSFVVGLNKLFKKQSSSWWFQINALMQDCSNSIANTLEILHQWLSARLE